MALAKALTHCLFLSTCLSGNKGGGAGSGKLFLSHFFLEVWWWYYCFKEGRTDESVRKSKRVITCQRSEAGFAVSCKAKARGRTMKEVFICGSWVKVLAKNRVNSLVREVDRAITSLQL